MFGVFKKINTPVKIQDFLDTIPANFEKNGRTCRSPFSVLQEKKAHCIEGALLAAAAFWYHGSKPLLLDLKTSRNDEDHVIALFKYQRRWGAISKTNHAVLRYRDPVYKTIRELVTSYFHEYFLDTGEKTLRSYSAPFSLLAYDDEWLISKENLFGITDDLDASRHISLFDQKTASLLRPATSIEIEVGKLVEWGRKE